MRPASTPTWAWSDRRTAPAEHADAHRRTPPAAVGVANGGTYASIGESCGSIAGFIAVGGDRPVVGVNNSTDFRSARRAYARVHRLTGAPRPDLPGLGNPAHPRVRRAAAVAHQPAPRGSSRRPEPGRVGDSAAGAGARRPTAPLSGRPTSGRAAIGGPNRPRTTHGSTEHPPGHSNRPQRALLAKLAVISGSREQEEPRSWWKRAPNAPSSRLFLPAKNGYNRELGAIRRVIAAPKFRIAVTPGIGPHGAATAMGPVPGLRSSEASESALWAFRGVSQEVTRIQPPSASGDAG